MGAVEHEAELGGGGGPDAEFAYDLRGGGWGRRSGGGRWGRGGEAEDEVEGAVCGGGEHGGEVGLGFEEGGVGVCGPVGGFSGEFEMKRLGKGGRYQYRMTSASENIS